MVQAAPATTNAVDGIGHSSGGGAAARTAPDATTAGRTESPCDSGTGSDAGSRSRRSTATVKYTASTTLVSNVLGGPEKCLAATNAATEAPATIDPARASVAGGTTASDEDDVEHEVGE